MQPQGCSQNELSELTVVPQATVSTLKTTGPAWDLQVDAPQAGRANSSQFAVISLHKDDA